MATSTRIPKPQRRLLFSNAKHLPEALRDGVRSFLRRRPTYVPPPLPRSGKGVEYRYRGKALHSTANPFREARNKTALLRYGKQNRIVVLGSGFLYDLEVFVAACEPKNASLVLVAESLEPFVACMFTRDLRFLEAFNQRIHLLCPELGQADPNTIPWNSLLDLEHGTGYLFLDHSSLYGASSFVRRCVRAMRQALQSWFSDLFTQLYFEKKWLQHSLQNLHVLPRSKNLHGLKGAFSGRTCAVIAAGPSLYGQLDLLRSLRAELVLIATDSALKPLLLGGCEPDFVVALDSGYYNALDFHGSFGRLGASCTLIAEPSIHPMVLRHFGGSVAFFSLEGAASSQPKSPYSRAPTLDRAPSVMNAAVSLALFMGFRTLHAYGLDLCFPFAESHCEGTIQRDYAYARSSKTNPMSAQGFRLVASRAQVDHRFITQDQFLRYKEHLEALVGRHSATTFVNHSPFGMPVAGMVQSSNKPRKEGRIEVFGDEQPVPRLPRFNLDNGRWAKEIADLERVLSLAEGLAEEQVRRGAGPEWSPEDDPVVSSLLGDLPLLGRGMHLLNIAGAHSNRPAPDRHAAFYRELSKLLRVLLAGCRSSLNLMATNEERS